MKEREKESRGRAAANGIERTASANCCNSRLNESSEVGPRKEEDIRELKEQRMKCMPLYGAVDRRKC